MMVVALPVLPVVQALQVPVIDIARSVLDKVTQGYLGDLVFLDLLSTSVVPI